MKSFGATSPLVALKILAWFAGSGVVPPVRQRFTVERSVPTSAANASSVREFSERYVSSFIAIRMVHGMNVHVKHDCASHGLAMPHCETEAIRMPPVAKPKRRLGRHYLKQWRQYRGYSQEFAGEFLGMARSNLSKIENGKVPYDQHLLEKAAELYKTDPASLIMRNPKDADAPWSIIDQLKPATRERALEVLRALRLADEQAA
jgi:transcriptional regulator with XRE-family HTH domain